MTMTPWQREQLRQLRDFEEAGGIARRLRQSSTSLLERGRLWNEGGWMVKRNALDPRWLEAYRGRRVVRAVTFAGLCEGIIRCGGVSLKGG